MLAPMKLDHIRMIAVLVMIIGLFLFSSMIFITLSNAAVPTGIAFTMFAVGLISGGIMAAFGVVFFLHPKLGHWGTN
jgi:hypothetical protein